MIFMVTIKDLVQSKQETRCMDFASINEAEKGINEIIAENIKYQQEFKIKIRNPITKEVVYFNNATSEDFSQRR